MKEFFTSWQFPVAIVGAGLVLTMVVLVARNLSWTPRGITPRGPGAPQDRPGIFRAFLYNADNEPRWILLAWMIGIAVVILGTLWLWARDWSFPRFSFQDFLVALYLHWWVAPVVGLALWIAVGFWEKHKKWLQPAVASVTGVLVLFTFIGWLASPSEEIAKADCKPVVSREWRPCLIPEAGVTMTVGQLTEKDEYRICAVHSEDASLKVDRPGENTYSLRSTGEPFVAQLRLIPIKDKCPKRI